jgi:hypothetical protein
MSAQPPEPTPAPERLPRRDLVIIPLIALATLFVLTFGAEVSARIAWRDQQRDACEVWRGKLGFFKDHCRSKVKLPEGPWVDYAYNDCGYRSAAPCTPKPAGTLRVAVLGSSIGRGYGVRYEDSFSGRVETQLTRDCGRRVEFQSIGVDEARGPTWHTLAGRVGEAEALRPDAIVTVIAPFDIMNYSAMPAPETPPAGVATPAPPPQGLMGWLRQRHFDESLALFGAQHFIYKDPNRYIPLYLRHGDEADFLRPPFSKAWRLRLQVADMTLGRIADQAHQAGIPMIVVFMPARGQAILSASPSEPKGIDPFALDGAIAQIAHRNHAAFVDVTQVTRTAANVADDFYPVDGHPNDLGHALIAQGLSKVLVGQVPAFAACTGGPSMRGRA